MEGSSRREERGRSAETDPRHAMVKVKRLRKMGTSGSVKEQAKGNLEKGFFVFASLPMNATCS